MKGIFARVPAAVALTIMAAGATAQTASSFDKSSVGSGKAYPAKPVRFIIGFAPGDRGNGDR